jgi:AraC-like DNA-binding protein
MSQLEQKANIKYCQQLGKSPRETFNTLKQVYNEEALGPSAVFKRHKLYAQGRDILEDDERSDRPKAVRTEGKIEEVATLVRASRSKSVDDIAAAVGISYVTCHKILTDDLNMSRVTQRSVPRVLTEDQRDDRMSV